MYYVKIGSGSCSMFLDRNPYFGSIAVINEMSVILLLRGIKKEEIFF